MATPVGTANVFCTDSEASGARAESPAGAYVFVVTGRLKPCHGGQQDVGHKGVEAHRMWVMQSLPQDAANLDCLPFKMWRS